MAPLLEIRDLTVAFEGRQVLKSFSLTMDKAQVHAVIGPAGSGKTALAFALMGHPRYSVAKGRILFEGLDFTFLPPDERAKRGLFLAFASPPSFVGVSAADFIRSAVKATRGAPSRVGDFRKNLKERAGHLGLAPAFAERDLNAGCSEAEKKRLEVLQFACLHPKLAILDGGAAGFDARCLEIAADGRGALLLLARDAAQLGPLKPHAVHRLAQGRL